MNYIPWVGQCFLRALSIDDRKSYVVLAAVWATDREDFLETARDALAVQHYTLYWVDNVMPANQWVRQLGPDPETISLARRVSPEHPVELGEVQQHQKDTANIKTEDWLQHQVLDKVKPLDAQLGVLDKLSVPESLHPFLFGQVSASLEELSRYKAHDQVPPLRTYAILDAARVPLLQERLDDAELPYQCLFKGNAEENLKSAAPYLVELQQNHRLTRQLFSLTGMASDLWDKYPGIYFRSRALIDELVNHFRRFTKVKSEKGKWLFFRFWESNFFLIALKQVPVSKALALMPPNLINSMLTISMDSIDYFKTTSLEDIPRVGGELTIDDKLKHQLDIRSQELFVFRLKQQFIEQQGMSTELFDSVMLSLKKHQFSDRKTIRAMLAFTIDNDCNLLEQADAEDELNTSQGMPDEIRYNRLVNYVNRNLTHDTPQH